MNFDVRIDLPLNNASIPRCSKTCYSGECGVTGNCECAVGYNGSQCETSKLNFLIQKNINQNCGNLVQQIKACKGVIVVWISSKSVISVKEPELDYILDIGPPSYGGFYKITIVFLSICLSVLQFRIFLRNSSLVFSDFLNNDRWLEYLKTDRALFSRKIHFCSNLGKKGPKWPQNRVLSLVFPGNTIKWKLILLLRSHHQHLAKFWFSSCVPKWCQPVKLKI